jgi:hypothetical protein
VKAGGKHNNQLAEIWLSYSCILLVNAVLFESQWVLMVLSVLWASQWELTGSFPFPSSFLHMSEVKAS